MTPVTKPVVDATSALPNGYTTEAIKCDSCGHVGCDCDMTESEAEDMSMPSDM